ncbi:leucyl aminopeptidase [Moraxella oblonga]|uniref:leucyl aminopeptidase n=1 Tax=Moraxella oblonga TaxID=200413 RepID=UPI00082E6AE9|nr:leucyl aminopeptidase [Moraxella oblonga]
MATLPFSLSVSPTLTLKKPTKTNPLPHIVVFADKNGNLLGNLDNNNISERATTLIKHANFKGGLCEVVSDFALAGEAPVLSVVGVGGLDKLANQMAKLGKTVYQTTKNSKTAVIAWGDVICQKHFGQFTLAVLNASYRFDEHKSNKANKDAITHISFINNKADNDYTSALARVETTFIGQSLARDVANQAPNIMTPTALAKVAKQLGKDYDDLVNVTVLDEKDMKKLGMGCFLAVSQGSDNEGKLAVIEYFGKSGKSKKAKLDNPIALVGKGITFDTGGISLKPAQGMDEMKFDMGGAASMLGTIKAICEARLPLDIVVVLACAENMPSGKATRPGDIVTAMNGMSVEILNTDAEGRLVLCDALCYVQENYHPKVIIDTATLTGACVIALGGVRSGLYTNDEDTLFALEQAGELTGDHVWQMPLDDDYDAQLKSPFADVQNIGGREGGSITAACFLKRFIKEGQAWAHLDIAGTAWLGGENKGATGRPVPTLVSYLYSQVK